MPGPRRKARTLALQALYEADLTGHRVEGALDHLVGEDQSPQDVARYARELACGVVANRERIDGVIARYATAFPVSQVSAVDRNILRLAIYEGLIGERTPVKVAIDEAVELAKTFGSETAPRFVNGVLGKALSPGAEKGRDG